MFNAIRNIQNQITGITDAMAQFTNLSKEARGANGESYFVEPNYGVDSQGYGKSWDKPFKTVAYALAISHANIGLKSTTWAKRNSVYYGGYDAPESLTKLAQKTDLVGMGSYDHIAMPGIVGVHAIDTTSYMGFRAFNVAFRSPAAGGDIVTLPTEQSGIAFLGCLFDGASSTAATGAIIATTVESLRIQGCQFVGAFSDDTIELLGTEFNSLMIADNIIQSGGNGIQVASTVTTSIRAGYILRNIINSTTIGINETSGKLYVHDNRVVTANAQGTAGAGAIVAGAKMMLNNLISASDVANAIVPANGSLA